MLAVKLLQTWAVLAVVTVARVAVTHRHRGAELAGFALLGLFLHAVWPPLALAAAGTLLLLLGQRS